MAGDDCCCICLEPLGGDVAASATHTLECAHTFHSDCLIQWLRGGARANRSCPLCRDGGDGARHMDGLTVYTRAKYLRGMARRAAAPRELKRRVGDVRQAEQGYCESRRALRAHRRDHRTVLVREQQLRRATWSARRRVLRATTHLGLFADPSLPLPNLTVVNYGSDA